MRVSSLLLAMLGFGLVVPAAAAPLRSDPWVQLRQGDLRVATVMYRLALANRGFCRGALEPQPGFALHGLSQYSPAQRPTAARVFGLGLHPGVMAVVADSPAARAGLRADDQLVSVNGKQLPSDDTLASTATDARVEAARQMLMAEMQKGGTTLLVSGADGDRSVHFTAEQGCPSKAEFDPAGVVNASADGGRVTVSAGLLARCTDDDDLALVIAHELAHNLLHHAEGLARAGIVNGFLPNGGSADAAIARTEEEADGLGVRLAIAAGYDLGHAAAFLNGLQGRPGFDQLPSTHPAPARRLALLTAAIADAGKRPWTYGFVVTPLAPASGTDRPYR